MKNFAVLLCVASCAATALGQTLTFVTNELGAGFLDITTTGGTPHILADDDDFTIITGLGEGNALFPGGGTWTIGNNGGMGYNIPLVFQNLPAGNALIPTGPNQIGPTFGGIQPALLPGWDDEGDNINNPVARVFTQVINNMLVVQWNELPVGTNGDTTTFQVQVPFGTPLQCGVYARFIYNNVENPTVNGGEIFSIGYQDGEIGTHNSINLGFNQANVIQNGTIFSLTCQDPCFWQTFGCAADYDSDLDTDSDDIIAFFFDWDRGDTCADVNRDAGIDSNDIIAFFQLWEQGGCQ